MRRTVATLAAIAITACGIAESENPIEAGTVRWGADLNAALAESKESGKPVFLLFQEIPGCEGCQEFGKTVLSSPLLVEAIEDEFVPVLVHNNKEGRHKEILERFDEPSWNYQVVRFLDADGHDLIPRKDRVWTIGPLASRMIETLMVAGRPVPKYLEAIVLEHETERHASSAFAMHCYWVGESELGRIDGVVSTEAGWLEGREVTRVVYDRDRITLDALARHAQSVECADKVYTPEAETVAGLESGALDSAYRAAKASDQNKQIEEWGAIHTVRGLNEVQRTKINAFAPVDRSLAMEWLSPRQRAALRGTDLHGQ